MTLEIGHDVERDAEDALVLRDRDDRRKAGEPGLSQRELEPRLAHHIVRRRRQRWARRASQHEPVGSALEQEREVRAAPFTDPPRANVSLAEVAFVEKRADAVEHEQWRLRQASCS